MQTDKKILIMEDEQVLGDVLKDKLEKEGYKASLARDGEEGMAKLKNESLPDLVLLDIIMPKINGYEVLEKMQADPGLKNIPVIIISNSGQPVEIERALAFGVKDYLVKAQFSPEEVMAKVEKCLAGGEENPGADKGGKIMIVEDDEFLRTLATKKLSSAGFSVLAAKDGEEALRILAKETFSLILLDVILPGMNGFDVLKKIKNEEQTKNIPVVLLSNLGQNEDIAKGKALGAADFLVKANFTLDEIASRIKNILAKS